MGESNLQQNRSALPPINNQLSMGTNQFNKDIEEAMKKSVMQQPGFPPPPPPLGNQGALPPPPPGASDDIQNLLNHQKYEIAKRFNSITANQTDAFVTSLSDSRVPPFIDVPSYNEPQYADIKKGIVNSKLLAAIKDAFS